MNQAPEAVASRSDTVEFLSPSSQPGSSDGGSGSARAGRHQAYYPPLEAF